MASPHTPSMNFIAAMGAPMKDSSVRQEARITALESQIEALIKEYIDLKSRLHKVERYKKQETSLSARKSRRLKQLSQ